MLTRDIFNSNAAGIARIMADLQGKGRQVAAFLIDHHPMETPFITSSSVLVVGWDDQPADEPALRWAGSHYSPSGTGSSLIHRDPDVALVMVANRLARMACRLEKMTGIHAWTFVQPHIVTIKDSEKLFRYMGKYAVKA